MNERDLAVDRWRAASSIDAARSIVARAFRNNQLEPMDPSARLALWESSFGSSSLVVVAAHGGWEVDPAPNGDFVVEHFAARGGMKIRSGEQLERCSSNRGVLISATKQTSFRLERDLLLPGIRVGVDRLKEHLRLITGRAPRDPIDFEVGVDLRRGAGARRHRLVRAVSRVLGRGAGPRASTLAAALEDTYLTALLTGQPHSQRHLLESWRPESDRRAVRRVEEYIRAHPEQPIRSEALVALSGVCTSALYDAFKRLRGTTPMRFLRDVRLERAREQLLRHPDATVTTVALDWGFSHLARFSGVYAKRFGELPSQTLAKARSKAS